MCTYKKKEEMMRTASLHGEKEGQKEKKDRGINQSHKRYKRCKVGLGAIDRLRPFGVYFTSWSQKDISDKF